MALPLLTGSDITVKAKCGDYLSFVSSFAPASLQGETGSESGEVGVKRKLFHDDHQVAESPVLLGILWFLLLLTPPACTHTQVSELKQ